MKKMLLLMTSIILMFGLASCDIFNIGGNDTTTETTETTTVDYENFIPINSVEDLQNMEMNKSYILNADLDLTGLAWQPIGSYLNPYLGNFDGNGHTISNLTISTDHIHNGLFGYLTGNVSDLNLDAVSIDYNATFITYAGGIAGYSNGNIEDCTVSGNIDVLNSESSIFLGMLVGFTQGKLYQDTTVEEFEPNLISNNTVTGTINAVSKEIGYIGGMIGKTYNTTVTMNASFVNLTVNVNDYSVYIGGVIGHNFGGILHDFPELVDDINIYIYDNVTVNTITVNDDSGSFSVGGFIGYNSKGYHMDNYVQSTITLAGDAIEGNLIKVGGYFGENWNSPVENIFIRSDYTNNLSAEGLSINKGALGGGLYGERTESTIYMFSPSNFLPVDSGETIETVDSTDLDDPDFFLDTFGWDQAFLDQLD